MKQKKRVKEGLVPADILSLNQMGPIANLVGGGSGSGSSCGSNSGTTATATGNVSSLPSNSTKNNITSSLSQKITTTIGGGGIPNSLEKLSNNSHTVITKNGNVKGLDGNCIPEHNNALIKCPLDGKTGLKDNVNPRMMPVDNC